MQKHVATMTTDSAVSKAPPPTIRITGLVDQVTWLLRLGGWTSLVLLGVITVAAITESIGISMLMPLLQLETGAAADDPISRTIQGAFEAVGLTPNLESLLLLIVVIFTGKGLIVGLQGILEASINASITLKAQRLVLERFSHLGYDFYAGTDSGYFTNLIAYETDRMSGCFMKLIRMSVDGIYTAFYLMFAGVLAPELTLTIIALGIVLTYLLQWVVKFSRRYSIEVTRANAKAQAGIIEIVQNFLYLRSTNATARIGQQLDRHLKRLAELKTRQGAITSGLSALAEPLAVFLLAGLILYQVRIENDTIADIFVVALFFYRALNRLLLLQQNWQRYNVEVGGLFAVQTGLRNFEEHAEPQSGKLSPDLDDAITFEKVGLVRGGRQVLFDVDVTIPPRGTVGLVGESGAGKTSFVNLITGLLRSSAGTIRLGDKPYESFDFGDLRAQIGYVTQDPVVFDDSLANNITLRRCEPDETECRARIEEACRLANCTSFIERLGEGLSTMIGERGVKLSGGQRQRVAIARELFRDPRLLILDEATSSLDSESERAIRDSIRELHGQRTVMIVAHRLSTVRHCDLILVFHQGRIVETGTFDELYADTSSRFHALCQSQIF